MLLNAAGKLIFESEAESGDVDVQSHGKKVAGKRGHGSNQNAPGGWRIGRNHYSKGDEFI